MKRLTVPSVLLAWTLAVSTLAEPLVSHTDVFTSGQDGYRMYRIPAIETTPDGSLLAFAEARKYGGGDPGFGKQDIDLVFKRSTDLGATWSAMQVLEDPGEGWSAANPATVVDRQTDRVWVLYLRSRPGRSTVTSRPKTDDMQTVARWSDDNGLAWSESIDLTEIARNMDDVTWKASVVGPGGMIQTRAGRLIAPVWRSSEGISSNVLAIFTEDHGRTWQRSVEVARGQGGNENQVVELGNGNILMDIRQNGGGHRWLSESSDGGKTWSQPRPGVSVSPVACAIERLTLKSAGDDRDRLLWTGPKGPGRQTLVGRISYDEGQTFTHEKVIADEPAAYSDLTILKDKTVGILWEPLLSLPVRDRIGSTLDYRRPGPACRT